jgi:hypothetical protein
MDGTADKSTYMQRVWQGKFQVAKDIRQKGKTAVESDNTWWKEEKKTKSAKLKLHLEWNNIFFAALPKK